MVAKEFYKKLIDASKKLYKENENVLNENWENFDVLENLYDEVEFDDFFTDLNLMENIVQESNYEIIDCRVLLYYLYMEVCYFGGISYNLEKCIITIITSKIDFNIYELNLNLIHEDIVEHIYKSFEKCLFYIELDTNIKNYVNKCLKDIQLLWEVNQTIEQISDLKELRIILLRLKHTYLQLRNNIELVANLINSLKEEDYCLMDKKINQLFD